LIGLKGNLIFHLEFVQAAIHLDKLGNNRRTRDRNSHLFDTRTGLGSYALHYLAHSFYVRNVLFHHGIGRQRLHRVAFDLITVALLR